MSGISSTPGRGGAAVPSSRPATGTSARSIFDALAGRSRTALAAAAPFSLYPNINDFCIVNTYGENKETGVLWAVAWALKRLFPNSMDIALAADSTLVAYITYDDRTNTGTTWDGVSDPPNRLYGDITPQLFAALIAAVGSTNLTPGCAAVGWLVDLTAATQVRELSPDNIKNYFASIGMPDVTGAMLGTFLKFAARVMPSITAESGLRESLSDTRWIDYHTSYSSSGKLCRLMLDAYPAISALLFTEEQMNNVSNSEKDQYSLDLNALISKNVLCATVAYHDAHGKSVPNWYQGNKARDDLPAGKYTFYYTIFEKAMNLSLNLGAIGGTTTMEQLLDYIKKNFTPGA